MILEKVKGQCWIFVCCVPCVHFENVCVENNIKSIQA